ncbi:MAG TPA: recombinase family protein [Ktedonobacteraceae bacterium]|nr:recombinase family protein [Ktedonobacteraceae bacterium]
MRTFQPRKKDTNKEPGTAWTPVELPIDEGLGIYARQSTLYQVKVYRQSTEMQTDDLIEFAKRLGWDEEKIILFTQDLAKSGKLRIDQREGLRTLIEYIEEGKIKTVLVFLEDRLFRDETGIQYNVFIDVCKRHGVMVVTPHMTYDFTNPFHVKQFRWRCEEAADYLRDYVIHRLHGAKNRLSESGKFAGRAIPVGFIVDRQETIIVDGKIVPNPTYRKFIVYEPHAKIVRWLFRRYWELSGRLRTLCRELQNLPFVFPEFEADVDVSKYLSQYHLKKVPGGYHISYAGMRGLLTNVAYIGYWVHHSEVVSKDNHEAIVAEDIFWYAFNRISPYTINGERNERENGYIRYSRKEPIPALLKNVIGSRNGGRVYVSTSGLTDKPIYIIEEKEQRLVLKYHAATPCQEIDDLFSARLVEHMKHTKRYEHYRDYAIELQKERDQISKSINDQLAEIDRQMEGILVSLSLPPDKLKKALREKLAAKYDVLEQQKEELEAKKQSLNTDQKTKKLMEYYLLADQLGTQWEQVPFADRQSLADVLVKGVYLDEMTGHWLRLEVDWLDPQWGTERTYIFRPGGAHKTWTDEENEIIGELYPHAAREEILAKLPRRTWAAIIVQARKLKVNRARHLISTCSIPDTVSMEDIAFMKAVGITMGETSCHTWETVHLLPPLILWPCHPPPLRWH